MTFYPFLKENIIKNTKESSKGGSPDAHKNDKIRYFQSIKRVTNYLLSVLILKEEAKTDIPVTFIVNLALVARDHLLL